MCSLPNSDKKAEYFSHLMTNFDHTLQSQLVIPLPDEKGVSEQNE